MNHPAKRYAKALFELSQEKKSLEVVYEDLKQLENLINGSDDLKQFIQNPVILLEKRQAILSSLFKDKFNIIVYQFLIFLAEKKRLALIQLIFQEFEKLCFQAKNIIRVKVTSRWALGPGQIKSICHYFKAKLKKEINPEQEIDPSIIGGVKIQVGDTVYDYSFKTQLDKFKAQILHAAT